MEGGEQLQDHFSLILKSTELTFLLHSALITDEGFLFGSSKLAVTVQFEMGIKSCSSKLPHLKLSF